MKTVKLELSNKLHALAKGFAGYDGKSLERFIIDALLTEVQAAAESHPERNVPEAHAD